MTPETSISNDQIQAIFKFHGLSKAPRIQRITIGFTNEIHQVDEYILKVYIRGDIDGKYDKESELYKKLQGKALVPDLVTADNSRSLIDKPYIIYKKIQGTSLGNCWHKLDDAQRQRIVEEVCRQVKIISSLEANPRLKDDLSWRVNFEQTFKRDLGIINQKKLLSEAAQERIKKLHKN